MSLVYCPECGHEISTSAVACPNCGRPLNPVPTAEKKVVVAHRPRREGFPSWAFIPIAAVGILLLIVLWVLFARNSDDANSNLRVNVNTSRPNRPELETTRNETTVGTATSPSNITVPGTSAPSSITASPVPGMPTKGTVVINAKIATRNGQQQAVKNEKFYLLDKDLESILTEARIEPIEGQTLLNSFGLSVMFPDRYGDFHRDALRAIKDHIKYAGTTDTNGKAQLGGIEPNSYYLFGVTKQGRGFAVWSSPVSIMSGENLLNLTPQQLTEVDSTSGD